MKAKEFFTKEWGTGFTKAILSEKKGVLEMSMEDIYDTMEKYAELCLSDVAEQSEKCKHLESDLIRNNSAGYKCKCGKEVTYY